MSGKIALTTGAARGIGAAVAGSLADEGASVVLTDDREAALAKLGRQVPLGRVGGTADLAHAVLYLASDEPAFVTGSEIRVDGGTSAM